VDWAGTKDRNAVTTQLFTVQSGDPEAVRAVEIRNADIELVGRAGRNIFFGDLAGNAFAVTVREPEVDDPLDAAAAVSTELEAFAGTPDDGRVGVPNFFGQQRFGSIRPVTHEVGLAVLRNDWEAAAMAYLGNPSEDEPEATQAAREYVAETRDWQGALEEFPRHLRYERTMLHALADSEGDYRTALETFPANLQSMFVNAAQSYVFNEVLSRRLARGIPFHEPVEGDVVCFADSDAPEGLALPDPDRTQTVTGSRVETVARHCARDRAFVTAPLVGTETRFAEGEPGEITRAVLDDIDIAPMDFSLPGEWASTGTRRAILVTTDVDVTATTEGDALTFDFTLPKGAYATVVLREYLKVSPLEMG
jgi:tRNA pseudouridine13 synthase